MEQVLDDEVERAKLLSSYRGRNLIALYGVENKLIRGTFFDLANLTNEEVLEEISRMADETVKAYDKKKSINK